MIKLKKILKEAIGKDLYSDSLPNSRAKEFQGALTKLEKSIGVMRDAIKFKKGGAVGKRKGDIHYELWAVYAHPKRSILKNIENACDTLTESGYKNNKEALKIRDLVKKGKIKIFNLGAKFSSTAAETLVISKLPI